MPVPKAMQRLLQGETTEHIPFQHVCNANGDKVDELIAVTLWEKLWGSIETLPKPT